MRLARPELAAPTGEAGAALSVRVGIHAYLDQGEGCRPQGDVRKSRGVATHCPDRDNRGLL